VPLAPNHKRIVVVRHGDTFGPTDLVTRVGARTDLPLVQSGTRQAQRLAEAFREQGWSFTAAACSPLQRTQQTAKIILQAQQEPPELQVHPFLTEIDYGPDENQPEEAVRARLGEALDRWEQDAIPPKDWLVEPTVIAAGWRNLFEAAPSGQTSLVVTSNGTARFALSAETATALPKLKTGAYGVIEVSPEGNAKLMSWNIRP
jgi:broad specificity phosphatase PhoE